MRQLNSKDQQREAVERATHRLDKANAIVDQDEARWNEAYRLFYDALGEFVPEQVEPMIVTPPPSRGVDEKGRRRPKIDDSTRENIRDTWRRMVQSPCFEIEFVENEQHRSPKNRASQVHGAINHISLWDRVEFFAWLKKNPSIPIHAMDAEAGNSPTWKMLIDFSISNTLVSIGLVFYQAEIDIDGIPPFDNEMVLKQMRDRPSRALRKVLEDNFYSLNDMAKAAFEFSSRVPSFGSNISLLDFLFEPWKRFVDTIGWTAGAT